MDEKARAVRREKLAEQLTSRPPAERLRTSRPALPPNNLLLAPQPQQGSFYLIKLLLPALRSPSSRPALALLPSYEQHFTCRLGSIFRIFEVPRPPQALFHAARR